MGDRIGVLPQGVAFVRETPRWSAGEVPPGLLRTHRVAAGVWGLLRVHAGAVTFVEEDSGLSRVVPSPAEVVIRPEMPHHVEPHDGAVISVAFYRQTPTGPDSVPGELDP